MGQIDHASDAALRRTMRRAHAKPLLTADEETALAEAWVNHRDTRAMHKLIEAYMRLASSMARRYRHYGLPVSDLTQEASIGLMQAVNRFEPARGVRFSTYASWWIRAAIQDYILRNWSIVRAGTHTAHKSLFFNLRRLQARMGNLNPTLNAAEEDSIARTLGVKVSDVRHMAMRFSAGDRSLDAPVSEDGDTDWQDTLADTATLSPEESTELRFDHGVQKRVIARALETLNARERRIIAARCLSDESMTLDALGQSLQISKERVRQIEQGALAKLKLAIIKRVGDPVQAGLI